jgi:putative heme iron utilization protein
VTEVLSQSRIDRLHAAIREALRTEPDASANEIAEALVQTTATFVETVCSITGEDPDDVIDRMTDAMRMEFADPGVLA